MRLALPNRNPVLIAGRSPAGSSYVSLFPWARRSIGFTWHHTGGISIVGVPKEGGTTICWGQKFKDRMREGVRPGASRLLNIGPLRIYKGRDF